MGRHPPTKTYSSRRAAALLDRGHAVLVRVTENPETRDRWSRWFRHDRVSETISTSFRLLDASPAEVSEWGLDPATSLVVLDSDGKPLVSGGISIDAIVDASDLLQFLSDCHSVVAMLSTASYPRFEPDDVLALANRPEPAVVFFLDGSEKSREWRTWLRHEDMVSDLRRFSPVVAEMAGEVAPELAHIAREWGVGEIPAAILLRRDGTPAAPSPERATWLLDITHHLRSWKKRGLGSRQSVEED